MRHLFLIIFYIRQVHSVQLRVDQLQHRSKTDKSLLRVIAQRILHLLNITASSGFLDHKATLFQLHHISHQSIAIDNTVIWFYL